MARVDREAVHCLLWARANDAGVVRVVQNEFALELAVSRFMLNRALQAMVEEGRLHRLSRSGNGRTQVYEVRDPADFAR